MEFLAAFPDADFDLSRYMSMESYHDQEENMMAMVAAAGGEVNHQSLLCSFVPVEMMNYSTTTTTTNSSSNDCSGNNSPLFDPAAHFTGQDISYYAPSTNFFNAEEAANNYNIIPMSMSNNNGTFPFEAPALVPSMLKRKLDDGLESQVPTDSPSDKKRPRVITKDSKSKRNNQRSCGGSPNHEEEITSNNNNNVAYNCGRGGQSSSSCNSEEEVMNGSQEYSNNNGDSKLVAKEKSSRASRGSATDPQSLYARKRRERINERLRILQTLVPNGTKVDISTMLEEAVHYVKFLQLQIKLLSSDDLWMYAPIAYNGVDVGLNQKLSTLL
ncbi:unnamed protein product [Linum tenue]|uniref:BHLH domain-containing protein n=1 Tax=Linum tenue TaxID=586396 RepID=A0AAV0P1B6_9ROSI|nr:unnamed protein product [Linum tenue]